MATTNKKNTNKTAKKTVAKKETATVKKEPVVETTPVETIPAPAPDPRDQQIKDLMAMVNDLKTQLANQRPQVVQVMADTERVVLRFQAEVADDCRTVFGDNGMFGQVTGKTGIISVPKSSWSSFYTEPVQNLIAKRWLIVISGLDDFERKTYGCEYKPGEVLDERTFQDLLNLGNELVNIYPHLCKEHQEMVATRFISAWQAGDPRAKNRDLLIALNNLSKETYKDAAPDDPRRGGLFAAIIKDLNERDI